MLSLIYDAQAFELWYAQEIKSDIKFLTPAEQQLMYTACCRAWNAKAILDNTNCNTLPEALRVLGVQT